ncbi:MAG TPA: hypothetical protein VIW94_01490 [Acidimicrobiia bacterium]
MTGFQSGSGDSGVGGRLSNNITIAAAAPKMISGLTLITNAVYGHWRLLQLRLRERALIRGFGTQVGEIRGRLRFDAIGVTDLV